jgi:hypothetical protein
MKTFNSGKSLIRQVATLLVVMMLSMLLFSCGSSSSDKPTGAGSIPLSSPQNFVITPKDGKLDLAWTKLDTVLDVVPSYEVWIGTTADNTQKHSVVYSDSSFLVACTLSTLADGTPLVNDTKYYIRLKAVYAGIGEAALSAAMEGTPVSVPGAPSISSQIGYEEMLDIVWAADVDATGYNVYWKQGMIADSTPPVDAESASITVPRILIKGVTNDVLYTVWVRSTNTAGDSAFASVYVTSYAASSVPTTPVASTDPDSTIVSSKTLTVSWPAVAYTKSYVLRYSTTAPSGAVIGKAQADYTEIVVEAESGTVSAKVEDLTNDTKYYFWVKAVNSKGESAFTYLGEATPFSKAAKTPIDFSNADFALGTATDEYIFAEDVPASAFFAAGRSSDRLTRFKETAVGNLFCDGTAWYVKDKYEKVDFVFLNGGYIEGPILKGDMTVGSVMQMIPVASLEDTLVTLSLTGEQVIELFRRAAAVVHTGRGSKNTGAFAMVSSAINYTIQYKTWDDSTWDGTTEFTTTESSPYQYGWIKEGTLKLNGEDIDPTKTYTIATSSWLANGNDGYVTFLNATNRSDKAEYIWQVVSTYVYEMGSVTPYLDGRLSLIGGVPLKTPGWTKGDLNWVAPYDRTLYMQ